jgi:hypothetical protein
MLRAVSDSRTNYYGVRGVARAQLLCAVGLLAHATSILFGNEVLAQSVEARHTKVVAQASSTKNPKSGDHYSFPDPTCAVIVKTVGTYEPSKAVSLFPKTLRDTELGRKLLGAVNNGWKKQGYIRAIPSSANKESSFGFFFPEDECDDICIGFALSQANNRRTVVEFAYKHRMIIEFPNPMVHDQNKLNGAIIFMNKKQNGLVAFTVQNDGAYPGYVELPADGGGKTKFNSKQTLTECLRS